jgi:hypothetical protein
MGKVVKLLLEDSMVYAGHMGLICQDIDVLLL